MCRMIAMLSDEPVSIQPYFDELCRMAQSGVNAPHADGFGVVFSDDDYIVIKELQPAWEHSFNFSLINTSSAMLHARKISSGALSLANVHPFIEKTSKGKFVFMHNGTVEDAAGVFSATVDDADACDSRLYAREIALAWERLPSLRDAVTATARLIRERSSNYTSANAVILSDNELFVIRICSKIPEYYTLYCNLSEKTAAVSTEAGKSGEWTLLDNHSVSHIRKTSSGWICEKTEGI